MALRDKLAEWAQPYLEPGETVRHVFMGQTSPHPLVFLIVGKAYVIVVTDRAILMLNARRLLPGVPKSLHARLPRNTPIGPLKGEWGQTKALGKESVWIHREFHRDVAAADAEIGGANPA